MQTTAVVALLMRIRMLIACVTLLLSYGRLSGWQFLLMVCVAVLSWLASVGGAPIVRRLLDHPMLAVLDIGVSFVVLGIGGPSGPFFLFTVVSGALAGLLYGWRGVLAATPLQIAGYALVLRAAGSTAGTFQEVVGQPIYYPLAGFAGVALHRIFERQAAWQEAERRAEAERERLRLARDMHDSLATTLRGIAMAAVALPVWVERDPDRAAREAHQVASAAELASREARSLISGLRDGAMGDPLPQAVRERAMRWGAEHGVEVCCDLRADGEVPLRIRYEVVAILGEALTNVARHSAAAQVSVTLSATPGEIELTVRDDGCGFRYQGPAALAESGHFGILGLHERAQRLGGSLAVRSAPMAGTTVTARVPVRAPAEVG
ncbi:MAG TPA: histidine kinase [Streptosporangiaceae bacterium]|jgi:signal transduction histidine kinase